VDAVTAPGPADTVAAQRARLAELDAALTRLRERYDLLMNAFKFDAAKPPPRAPPPAPSAVAARRRRRR
jgi:hypothetical protein